MRRGFYGVALTLTFAVAANGDLSIVGLARADPAVSRANGKLVPFGGVVNDEGTGGLAGALTLPLGHEFGIQTDGVLGSLDGDLVGGGAVHVFWRDPELGLLGIYGSYVHLDAFGGLEISRVGVEAEKYLGQITFRGKVGYRDGDVDDGIFGSGAVNFYITDDFVGSVGYFYDDDSFLTLGVETQIASTDWLGTSLFAEGQINDGDTYSVLGGVTFYFSDPKSLRDRHRRDDPPISLTEDFSPLLKARSNPTTANSCPVPIDFGQGHANFCFSKPGPSPQLFNACRCGEFFPA